MRSGRMRTPTRRRLLQVSAGLASLGVGPAVPGRLRYRWTGPALGAAASLDLYHDDRAEAARLVARMVARSTQRASASSFATGVGLVQYGARSHGHVALREGESVYSKVKKRMASWLGEIF